MGYEDAPHEQLEEAPLPDGERWLNLMGYGHLKGQPSGYSIDGEPVPVEEFNRLDDVHSRPIFTAIENLDPTDPRYEMFLGVARKAFQAYFGPVEPVKTDT